MGKILTTLGDTVDYNRRDLQITSYQLADKAGVHQSLISGIQSGARFCGENNARKIGGALDLSGNSLTQFIYLALNGSVDRVFFENQKYPAEILNLLPFKMHAAGIEPENIARCVLKPRLGGDPRPDAVLYLSDGSKVRIEVTVANT